MRTKIWGGYPRIVPLAPSYFYTEHLVCPSTSQISHALDWRSNALVQPWWLGQLTWPSRCNALSRCNICNSWCPLTSARFPGPQLSWCQIWVAVSSHKPLQLLKCFVGIPPMYSVYLCVWLDYLSLNRLVLFQVSLNDYLLHVSAHPIPFSC